MPDGFRVAKGYIEVDPDMTGFADKVRAELDREENHAKVKIEPDMDGFGAKLRAALDAEKTELDIRMALSDSDVSKMKADLSTLRGDLRSTMTGVGSDLGSDLNAGIAGAIKGGASDATGAAGGGDGGGLEPPWMQILKGTIIGGLVSWGVSLLPAIVPTVFGGFFGAAGAYIDVEGNAKLKASLTRVLDGMKKDIEKDTGVFTAPIYALTKGASIAFQGLQPVIKSTFSDSVPYLKTFVGILEDMAFIILPPLDKMLKDFAPYLPEVQMGFDDLAKGIAGFMKGLGPGMKPAAELFQESMNVIGHVLEALGYTASGLAISIQDSSHAIRIAWDDTTHAFVETRHETAVIFDGMRHDIAQAADGIVSDVKNRWRTFWNMTIGQFTEGGSTTRTIFRHFTGDIEGDADAFTHTIEHSWDLLWNNTLGEFTQSSSTVRSLIRRWTGDIEGDWTSMTGTIHRDWDSFWGTIESDARGAVSRVSSIVHGIENAFETPIHYAEHDVWDPLASVWNRIASTLHLTKLPTYAAGGILPGSYNGPPRDEQVVRVSGGESILNQGATAAVGPGIINYLNDKFSYPGATSDATHFAAGGFPGLSSVEHVASAAANTVKGAASHLLSGAVDIAKFMANPLGELNALVKDVGGGPVGEMMTDLIKKVPQAIVSNLLAEVEGGSGGSGPFTGKYGAGVAQWRPDVLAVLSMLGLPAGLASRVLYQMQTESGGNPNAINLSDSNAAAGDPSRGLLQTIMSTFEAFRSPSLPNDIYNPMANIYAAVHYAETDYGPTLMRGGMGMGSGHGYASGGRPAEGEFAVVGEQGPELVQFGAGATVYSNKASGQIINDQSKGPLIGSFTIVQQEVGTTADAMNALTYTLRQAQLTANSARSR